MTPSKLPKFIIVGAPRSGSTFLMQNLMTHPQIYMPEPINAHSTGDVHFFDISRKEGASQFRKGLSWYAQLFADAPAEAVIGEKTADYLADELACKLIRENLGPIKIVISLRDPVSRAQSHFWHERHNLSGIQSPVELITKGQDMGDAWVLKSGMYGTHLERYFEAFGRENVHVVVQDDLQEEPRETLRALCQFLEIDETVTFKLAFQRINQGTSAKSAQWIKWSAKRLQGIHPGLFEIIRDSIIGRLAALYLGKLRATRPKSASGDDVQPLMYPGLSEDEARCLKNFYREEVTKASRLLDRDLGLRWWRQSML